jgi:hypothetical protein
MSFTRYYNPQFYLQFEASPPQCPSTPYDAKVGMPLCSCLHGSCLHRNCTCMCMCAGSFLY